MDTSDISSPLHENDKKSNEDSEVSENGNNIQFIEDEDSRLTLMVESNKIMELQNAIYDLDEKHRFTKNIIKAMFIQFTALQRVILRRHLKICKEMIKDLGNLIFLINKDGFPFRSAIVKEHKLWKNEISRTYEKLFNLKKHTLLAITCAASSNYTPMMNTPVYVSELKNTKSILHEHFEPAYSNIWKGIRLQHNSMDSLRDIIEQHNKIISVIYKIGKAYAITGQSILLNTLPRNNYFEEDEPFYINRLDNSNWSMNNLYDVTEDNQNNQ